MNEQNSSPITCRECGCIIEGDPAYLNGEPYCPDCVEAKAEELEFVKCDYCGEWVPCEEADPFNGVYICNDCRDNICLEYCDECRELSDDVTIVIGRYRSHRNYCPHCLNRAVGEGRVFYCEECETYYEERYFCSYITHHGATICESCYQDSYGTCYDCDEIFHTDDLHWSESDDCWYCDSCYRSNDHDDEYGENCIHEYSYKPSPTFHGLGYRYTSPLSDDPITMGFELEVDKGRDRKGCANKLDDYFGSDTLYMKNDSSVDFEIVTHPHTLKAYLSGFDFDKLCFIPIEYGYKSHDAGTCGFHIHVGRRQLGTTPSERDETIAKIALLVYRHWKALVKFSRRTESQLSSWAAAPNFVFNTADTQYNASSLTRYVLDYYRYAGRYQALNVCPRETIEFRLWRGSLNPNTLKATLQLTSNLVLFAKAHTVYDVAKSSWEDITSYETCPELEAYLAEKNLVSFDVLQTIPFANDVALPYDPVFDVGDRVVIRNAYGSLVERSTIGCRGTICGYRVTNGELNYALRFDSDTPLSILCSMGHSCEGLIDTNDGYWVYAENVEKLRPAELGSTVRIVLGNSRPSSTLTDGLVVHVFDNGDLGLHISGLGFGHDLGGILPVGSRDGWIVPAEDVVTLENPLTTASSEAASF